MDKLGEEKLHIAKTYNQLGGEKQKVDWNNVFFSNMARPRAKLQLWMLFLGSLATRDRLRRFGFNIENSCVFITGSETIDHLFFHYKITQTIWKNILDWIGYNHVGQSWDLESRWIVQEVRKKDGRGSSLKLLLLRQLMLFGELEMSLSSTTYLWLKI